MHMMVKPLTNGLYHFIAYYRLLYH